DELYSKEVVGIHNLLTHSHFAADILRRLLLRVSLAKPTSAPFAVLMAAQNEASILVSSAPTAARNAPRSLCSSAHHQRSLKSFPPLLLPPLPPQELRRYDPRDAKLQPLLPANMAYSLSHRCPILRPRSARKGTSPKLPLPNRQRELK